MAPLASPAQVRVGHQQWPILAVKDSADGLAMAKCGFTYLAAFLLAVASCEPAKEHIGPEAGSQLKPLYVALGEESVFQGWFDKRLDDRCDFYDNQRCVPPSVEVYFPDSACASVPIAVACSDQKVALSQNQGFDGIFRLSPTTAGTELHYKTAGTCERLLGRSPPLSSKLQAFALAATAPPVELPEKRSEDKVQLNEELDLVVRSMSDGSRQPSTMFDRVRKQACWPSWTSAGYRCIPHGALPLPLGGESFLDESCTVPALKYVWEGTDLVASDDAGTKSPSAVASPFAERPTSAYRVERLADGPYSIFTRTNGTCVPAYTNQVLIHPPLALGKIIAKVDASQFPKVARPHGDVLPAFTFTVGNKIVSFTSSGGLLRRGIGACYIHRMLDGRRACLTAPVASTLSYLDPECTKAVTFLPKLEPSTDRVLVKSDAATWCRTTTATMFGVSHHVTTSEEAFFFRDPDSGACLAHLVANKVGTEYWQIEAEQALRADDLVVDEERYDP